MWLFTLAQQVVDLTPDSSAIPGASAIAGLVRGIAYIALLACGAAVALGAGQWGFGSLSTNPYNVAAGKRVVVLGLAGAALIGASGLLVSRFFSIGQGVR
jgi:hypothetical protein